MNNEKLLELCEIYIELVDKQDDIIRSLAKLVTKLSMDLEQCKIAEGIVDMNETRQQEIEDTFGKIEDYRNSLEP